MQNKKEIYLALLLIIISVLFRIVDNTYSIFNFTPIIAISLFAGNIFKNKNIAIATPIIAMLFTDLYFQLFTNIPGFYGISQIVNYIALIIIVFVGMAMNNKKTTTIVGFSFLTSFIFFVISNFGVWLGGYYGFTLSGLSNCFIAALPFFKSSLATNFFVNSIFGNLLFSSILFAIAFLSSKNKYTSQAIA